MPCMNHDCIVHESEPLLTNTNVNTQKLEFYHTMYALFQNSDYFTLPIIGTALVKECMTNCRAVGGITSSTFTASVALFVEEVDSPHRDILG